MLLLAAEMVDSAEQCFLNSAVLDPNDIRWPHYLGHCEEKRRPSRATGDFERVIQLEPMNVLRLSGWVTCTRRRTADDAESSATGLTVDAHNVGVLAIGTNRIGEARLPCGCRTSRRLAVDAMRPAPLSARARVSASETFRMPARTFALAVTARKPWPIR
jgi:hypothetical protein